MPWCGMQEKAGPDAIMKTFADVGYYWEVLEFEPTDVFGDETKAAVFGSFTYSSRKLQKTVTSPFSVFVKLDDSGFDQVYAVHGGHVCDGDVVSQIWDLAY